MEEKSSNWPVLDNSPGNQKGIGRSEENLPDPSQIERISVQVEVFPDDAFQFQQVHLENILIQLLK